MSVSRRDFRSAYLNTLGFQEVPIQSAVVSLLREPVIDIGKLKRLNWKFETPTQHRPLIWKLMLGTLPQHRETWEFVQQQLNEQYKDLKRTATLINSGTIDESIRVSRDPQHIERTSQLLCTIYAMRQDFLMRERDSDDVTELKRVASVFATMFDSECEAYWSFHKFMSNSLHRRGNKGATIMHHVNNLAQLLKAHDPVLYQHLLETNTKIETLSYAWFRSIFGVCFVEPRVLETLWDRMIRVSYNLMPCIALAILHQFREHIMNFNDSKSIYHILKNITGSQFLNADLVMSRAVDVYTQWKNDSSAAHDSMK
jgi:hypothetical protein